jgi:hypothetical protein
MEGSAMVTLITPGESYWCFAAAAIPKSSMNPHICRDGEPRILTDEEATTRESGDLLSELHRVTANQN